MKEIKIPGFTTNVSAQDQLAIAVFGLAGSGKTRFCCTAPDPIGFIPLDRKTRRTVERVSRELGKTVVMPEQDFVRVENPMKLAVMDVTEAKKWYRAHVNRIKEAAFRLYDHKQIRSIVIDSASQLWEDMLFAEFGRAQRIMPRDRGAVNQEMIDLLNCLGGKHLILTHKASEIWSGSGDSARPTGKYEWKGFPHLGYHVNVIAELVCNEHKGPADEGRFTLNVVMCQDNPDIQGPGGKSLLQDASISFQMLALQIYPDSNLEDWE